MKPILRSQGQSLGLHEALSYYEHWLPRPNNYVRIARQYLEFLLENAYSINAVSAELFVTHKNPSYQSAIKKFLKFAAETDLVHIYRDEIPKFSGHPTVLRFLAEAQLRQNSKETYAKALDELHKFLESRKLPLARPSVLDFIEFHRQQQHSAYTINSYLSAIKQYVDFCIVSRDQLDISKEFADQLRDILSIKGLKIGGTVRTYAKDSLTKKERNHLLAVITDARDRLIIGLMVLQGLRSVEVTRLIWEDFQQYRGKSYIAVLGKGRNEKEFIPLLKPTQILLTDYRRVVGQVSGELFSFNSTTMIRKITNHWLEIAGLKREKISAHSLRHTTAQLMLDDGVPKAMVQRFLRHKSEATTSLYTAKQEDRVFLEYNFNR
ncbi:MAG: tyrosine-type recombinase/integrase [Bacteroidota bacterium]